MTFYDMLGLPREATQEEIRAAYRELARQYHPDGMQNAQPGVRAQAEENLKAINAAYDTLGNPAKRLAYHEVMWTRHDPARKYKFRGPGGAAFPRENGAPAKGRDPDQSAALRQEIQFLKQERIHLAGRQGVRQRRLWLAAGFTTLLVFVLMSFRAGLPSAQEATSLVFLFFVGVEMIALPLMVSASGMALVQGTANPVMTVISITAGFLLVYLTTLSAPYGLWSQPTTYSGIVVSAALGVHLLAGMRLSRAQEELFNLERRSLDERLRLLESRLDQMNEKRRKSG